MKSFLNKWKKFLKEEIISFDFDDTLLSTCPRKIVGIDMIEKMNFADMNNKTIFIVTSRDDTVDNRNYILSFVEKNNLPVDEIFLLGDFKYKFLSDMNVNIHFDDDPAEIKLINKYARNVKGMKVTPLKDVE